MLIHISANFVVIRKKTRFAHFNSYLQMKKAEWIPVIIVSAFLLVYLIMEFFNRTPGITRLIFSLSPLLIVWLVYSVIRYGDKNSRKLKNDEEWGYADM